MKTLTLEEIDNKSKALDNSLNQLSLEKKKFIRKEKELFEMHRQSLLPLRQILELPLSSSRSVVGGTKRLNQETRRPVGKRVR